MKKKFIPLFLLPLTSYLSPLEASAQKLAPSALHAARQHQVVHGGRVKSLAPQETVSGIIRISSAEAITELEALGIVVRSNINDRFLTATMPVGALEAAAQLETVERIELGAEVRPTMDVARAEAGADPVRTAAEGLERAYKGKGVIVGVVDQGFEYTHIDFKAEDGTTPRIKTAWNQKYSPAHPDSPEGFAYGTEYKTWNQMAAVDNDYQYDTFHGSHVAGIAAGADLTTPYYGLASESDLVFVTYDTTADQIVDGVKYIFDYADRVGKPCVINLSIGMHTGPHDGTSVTDQALNAMTGPGRIIVGAVGNEGTTAMHVGKQVTASDPLKVIPSFYNDNTKVFVCDFWGQPGKTFYVQPIAVNSLKGSIVGYGEKVCCNDYDDVRSTFNMADHGIDGTVDVTVVHDLDNGRGNFYISGNVVAQGTGRMLGLLFTTDEGEECIVDGWHCYYKDFAASTNCLKQGFTAGDYRSLCGEIGGTAQNVISVGSYNTRLDYTSVEGITYAVGGPNYTLGDHSPFSSNGPTSDGRMKPDVCAPGFGVISAAQRHAITTGTCAYVSKDAKGTSYYYEFNAGTSMASPYVTGSVALWLEARPELTPDEVRHIIRATSRRDAFTGQLGSIASGLPMGDNRWGYGKIDTYAGLLYAANFDEQTVGIDAVLSDDFAPSSAAADASNLRVIVDRSARRLIPVLTDTALEVYNAAGRLVGRSTDLSALPAGTYIVRLTRGASSATQKIVL